MKRVLPGTPGCGSRRQPRCRWRIGAAITVLTASLTHSFCAPLSTPGQRVEAQPRPAAMGPAPFVLGYDAIANLAFEKAVRETLQEMDANGRAMLCMPLQAVQGTSLAPAAGPVRKPSPGCGAQPATGVSATVHMVMLRDGVIWRFASSFEPGIDRPLGLGSVAKAVLALPLLALNGGSEGEAWCERIGVPADSNGALVEGSVPPERSAVVGDGVRQTASRAACPPGASLTARAAFAASRNAPLVDRLRRIQPEQIREQLVAAKLQGAASLRYPAVAVPLGLVELTPRQTVECFDALAGGQARRAAFLHNASGEPSEMARWCASVVSEQARRRYVRSMLRAPAEPGGTAGFAAQALAGTARIAPPFLAKTGTPSDVERRDLGKTLLLSFVVGSHRYTALLIVVSPSAEQPLAKRLPGDFLLPLVRLVAQHALQ